MDLKYLEARLDAESYEFAKQVAAAPAPNAEQFAATLERERAQRASFVPKPPGRMLTLAQPTDERPALKAALYPPPAETSGAGLMLFMHGGGFVVGSAASAAPVCRVFAAEAGCYVLDLEYRLAPRWPFPAAVQDCVTALRWAADNADGWDPSRLAIGGSSAGANLAASTALLSRADDMPHLSLQVLLCPLLDFRLPRHPSRIEMYSNPVLGGESLKWFESEYLTSEADREDPRASPLCAPDLSGSPPALIISGAGDPLCDEAAAYAERLLEAGCTVDHRCYPSVHSFVSLFDRLPVGRKALDHCVTTVRRAIGTQAPMAAQ